MGSCIPTISSACSITGKPDRGSRKAIPDGISLDPQYAEGKTIWRSLWTARQGRGSRRLFRVATENNPPMVRPLPTWAMILASESRFPEPHALSSAIQMEPKNTGALSAYGMVLVRFEQRLATLWRCFSQSDGTGSRSPSEHI